MSISAVTLDAPLASSKRWWKTHRFTIWWIAILVITFARLALTAKDEMWVTQNDAINYVKLVQHYFTGGPQDLLPSQRPGISILGRLSAFFGIPYALFLDGLHWLTAYYAAACLRRWSGSFLMGWLGFAALFLNPWFLRASRTFLSEPPTALLLLLLVLSAVPFLSRPPQQWRIQHAIFGIVIADFLALTRPENPLVYAWSMFLAILALVPRWSQFRRMALTRQAACVALIFLPSLGAFLTVETCKRLHHFHYGVAAVTRVDAPGLVSLMNALYSVHPVEEIRFAPVPRDTLRAACDHSPTLNENRAKLLDVRGSFYGACGIFRRRTCIFARNNRVPVQSIRRILTTHSNGVWGRIRKPSSAFTRSRKRRRPHLCGFGSSANEA
jgi:hypothetical protein